MPEVLPERQDPVDVIGASHRSIPLILETVCGTKPLCEMRHWIHTIYTYNLNSECHLDGI